MEVIKRKCQSPLPRRYNLSAAKGFYSQCSEALINLAAVLVLPDIRLPVILLRCLQRFPETVNIAIADCINLSGLVKLNQGRSSGSVKAPNSP